MNPESLVPRFRAVIYDLDGTLADTLPLIYLAFNDALRPLYGRTLDDGEIRAMFGPPDNAILRSVAPAGEAEAAIGRYLERYRAGHAEFVSLYDGMKELLETARHMGVKQAVVTGKSRETALFTLEMLGVLDLFDATYAGDDVERQKPDPEAIIAALRDVGVEAGRDCVIVGDSAADVMAGKAAGIATIGVRWGNPDHADLDLSEPDAMCDTVEELALELGLAHSAEVATTR